MSVEKLQAAGEAAQCLFELPKVPRARQRPIHKVQAVGGKEGKTFVALFVPFASRNTRTLYRDIKAFALLFTQLCWKNKIVVFCVIINKSQQNSV